MLFFLFDYLQNIYDFPGSGLVQYISFRAALAIITSLLVSLFFGASIIKLLQKKQIGEEVRKLGLSGEELNLEENSILNCGFAKASKTWREIQESILNTE